MRAKQGDVLVVEGNKTERRARRATILDVRGADGSPPYYVRWQDDGRECLTYPGPDAHVTPPEQ